MPVSLSDFIWTKFSKILPKAKCKTFLVIQTRTEVIVVPVSADSRVSFSDRVQRLTFTPRLAGYYM